MCFHYEKKRRRGAKQDKSVDKNARVTIKVKKKKGKKGK
jgi:hypothetical protein